MILTHELGTSLSLSSAGSELPLWKYVYGGKPKPFFHPLTTPAGHCLTIFEPSDHVWQRGLWFAPKFINGQNFWEEKEHPFASQVTTSPLNVTHEGPAIRVESKLAWVGGDNVTLMDEARTFVHTPVDQDSYTIDFTFALSPRVDVEFNRTPFNGKWGGYGGMAFRGNRNWLKTQLLFDDGTYVDRPIPKPSKWCDLTGLIDGGRSQYAGIAILDHPGNVRYPTPWYGGTGPNHYFNAAMFFHEPLNWPAGKLFELKYRVLVHDQAWDADRLNAAWTAWEK
ncbi:MAG: hypothetical protein JWM57_2234 [Phycisphaerales bacterium]|nr:hypothetical protein [Phycisphaerales bacterium]